MPDANDDVTFDNPIPQSADEPPTNDAKPPVATGDEGPSEFRKGQKVQFRGQSAEVTFVYGNGLYDVQLIDEGGEPLRDANNQPQWFPMVKAKELS